jgi:D-alanyl-D-alanine carboxypeptidase (penicillin-binding protein 5/6)
MKNLCSFFLISFIFQIYILAVNAEQLDINATSYILIDSKSGNVLYEHNANEQGVYPASTTKIMTAILALENGSLDQTMTASKQAVYDIGKDGMNIGIMPGEEIRMENLLEALLISSANETANIIAENICPTREDFVNLMNERARELGAVNTHFENPCGAHDDTHYTTARDMAKIAQHAMTIPKFREIVAKTQYIMPSTNKHEEWPVLATSNKLLWREPTEHFKINGIKTGYTGPAGNNLVASGVNNEGMELISVILGVKTPTSGKDIFTYSYNLLEYGFKNFSLKTLVEKNQVIASISVINAADEDASLDLVSADSFKVVLPADAPISQISKKEYINQDIEAPVNKGDTLGYIEYQNDSITLGRIELVASRNIEKKPELALMSTAREIGGNSVFKRVVKTALIILALFAALRFTLRSISRRRRMRKRFRG